MTYTATVIPQLVFPSDVARKMFDAKCKMCRGSYSLPLGVSCHDHQPQRIMWLAGPVDCEWCVGEGWLYGEPDHYERGTEATMVCEGDNGEPSCLGLGYPPIVEIVSMCCDNNTTVHGRLALGTPVPVGDKLILPPEVDQILMSTHRDTDAPLVVYTPSVLTQGASMSDITEAVAGTLVPGGVAYPVTVTT